jgi:hypothetical protein
VGSSSTNRAYPDRSRKARSIWPATSTRSAERAWSAAVDVILDVTAGVPHVSRRSRECWTRPIKPWTAPACSSPSTSDWPATKVSQIRSHAGVQDDPVEFKYGWFEYGVLSNSPSDLRRRALVAEPLGGSNANTVAAVSKAEYLSTTVSLCKAVKVVVSRSNMPTARCRLGHAKARCAPSAICRCS